MDNRTALLNELVPELRRCGTALTDISNRIQRVLGESSEESAPIPSFPPEIWHEIFTYLRSRDLSNVRLACRTFNDIVSSSSRLMEHYPINIKPTTINTHRDRIHALGTTSSSFRNVVLEDIKVVNPGVCYWFLSIWENVGGRIWFLEISNSDVPAVVMFRILACMPELREFNLYPAAASSLDVFEQPNMNLMLPNLRDFSMWVKNAPQMPLLRTFLAICPNLKILDLTVDNALNNRNIELTADYEQAVLEFVTAIRSIEQMTFNVTNPLLSKMSEVSGLGFKKVTFEEGNTDIVEQNIVSFVRSIPTIETLFCPNIEIKDFTTLTGIGKSLPNLTWICLTTCSSIPRCEDFSFLLHMPKLEYLRLQEKGTNLLWFKTSNWCRSPKLTEICLGKMYLPQHVLPEYLRRSPGITCVELSRCTFEYASDVVFLITRLKSLKTLNLCETSFTVSDNVDVLHIDGFSNVRSMELSLLQQHNELVMLILNLCPALVTLRLVEWIDDDMIREVCQSLTQLKCLSLVKCHMTRTGFRYLHEFHGKTVTLEKLFVVLRPTQATEKKDIERLLKQMRKVFVHVT